MVYKLRQSLVGGGFRTKTIIDGNGVVDVDEIRLSSESNIQLQASTFQGIGVGTTHGYAAGGYNPPPGAGESIIEKFPFASSATSTDTGGDLNNATGYWNFGISSPTHGFSGAGYPPDTSIEKWPFAISSGTATDVGNLKGSIPQRGATGGSQSTTHGYIIGGLGAPGTTQTNHYTRFPFSISSGEVSLVGNLTVNPTGLFGTAGQSSATHGYVSGGQVAPSSAGAATNNIQKFPFAVATGGTTNVGDMSAGSRALACGHSSAGHGYTSGGERSASNVIDKFPFSSDTSATDVGDLTVARSSVNGQSSVSHGYVGGGDGGAPTYTPLYNIKDMFSFASDYNAIDVGDMSQTNSGAAGHEG